MLWIWRPEVLEDVAGADRNLGSAIGDRNGRDASATETADHRQPRL